MHPDSINSKDCCKPCREDVSSVLRRKARSMHEAALRLEALADVAERLSGNEEAALYDLVVNSR